MSLLQYQRFNVQLFFLLQQLVSPQGLSHNMYVLDSFEDELGIGIESLGLVALPSRSVGHCVDLGSGVNDVKEVGARIHLHNTADVSLIIRRPTWGITQFYNYTILCFRNSIVIPLRPDRGWEHLTSAAPVAPW